MIGYCGLQMKCSEEKKKESESRLFSVQKGCTDPLLFEEWKWKRVREKMEDFDRIFHCGGSSISKVNPVYKEDDGTTC